MLLTLWRQHFPRDGCTYYNDLYDLDKLATQKNPSYLIWLLYASPPTPADDYGYDDEPVMGLRRCSGVRHRRGVPDHCLEEVTTFGVAMQAAIPRDEVPELSRRSRWRGAYGTSPSP